MDKQTIERIFEPFFSTKEPGRGTGLGLSTVYGSVKQHEGWIKVQSDKHRGTAFMIHFPANLNLTEDQNERNGRAQDIRGNGECILLVEDDGAVRDLTAKILRDNGYSVLEARSAEEAVEIIDGEDREIDIIFSDVVLPGRSGIQMVEELVGSGSRTKIILASGYAAPKSQWDLIQEKGYRFLQKPYKMVELLKAMKEACTAEK
jgi:two-component system cell cycle sensor histidine kinase/response regulator CckA